MKYAKAAVAVALVAVALVGLSVPAAAHVTQLELATYLFSDSDPQPDSVIGSITCTAGEKYLVKVKIQQKESGYFGTGRDKGECTGSSQTWEVFITEEHGTFVCGEPWEAVARARTFLGGAQHGDEVSDRETDTFGHPCP